MDTLIQIIDELLFLCISLPIVYLFVFAIASLFKRTGSCPAMDKKLRYVVFLPAHSSFATQKYPEELYDVVSYTTLYDAIQKLDAAQYDMAVILGETTHVSKNLLKEINEAHEAGATAIQLHHVITPRNSSKLRIKAFKEEIRNSFFKQGAVHFGLSSAMDGIDIAVEFPWLKNNLKSPKTNLERRLIRQNIYVDYLEHVRVESSTPRASQYRIKKRKALYTLPKAIMDAHWDYVNKIVQWLLPSCTTLLISITLIATWMLYYHWISSLRWWGLLFLLIFTICLAIPDYLIEKPTKKK